MYTYILKGVIPHVVTNLCVSDTY